MTIRTRRLMMLLMEKSRKEVQMAMEKAVAASTGGGDRNMRGIGPWPFFFLGDGVEELLPLLGGCQEEGFL
jgi:hypothetical protein